MRLRILGSAAGGGFPQWNCGCENCARVRAGAPGLRPRTQASAAVSADGERWFLLGASPDARAQIEAFAELHPRAPRHTPIAGVLLPNGDLDACVGLFSLREDQPIAILASRAVRDGFVEGNPLARRLAHARFAALPLGVETRLDDALFVTAVPAPGKPPLHLEGKVARDPGENVGFVVRHGGATVAYFPSVAGPSSSVERAVGDAALVIFDGTFFREDELVPLGGRAARHMAHWPLDGGDGSLGFLAGLPGRKILTHVNNTNPILDERSAARAQVDRLGVEVAHDGLEVRV